MLRQLRWQLTLLYLVAGFLLILLMGSGAYGVLYYYFRITTDQALYHRMAHDVAELGLPLSPKLLKADQDWYARRGKAATPFSGMDTTVTKTHTLWENYQPFAQVQNSEELEEYYDGEMAAMFVLPLDANGKLVFDPNPVMWSHPPNQEAVAAARRNGNDLRTIRLSTGARARLLTYQLTRQSEEGFLQIGRALNDQDRLLSYLWLTLFGMGTIATLGIGAASWGLAGRSIRPAQRAWRQQQTFIANASHELRAPLTLLRASIEVAQSEGGDSEFSRQVLQDALSECDHMASLVEDLLTLSRLDAGKLTLHPEPVDIARLFEEIHRQVARIAEQRAITLHIQTEPFTFSTDPLRLRQVILIALDNALRHTPSGGRVDLIAQLEKQQVQIVVRDTGEGIDPKHLPHLFERFYRVENERGSESKGSGLGLPIAASLVKAMGGEAKLSSRLGQGTEVLFRFPQEMDAKYLLAPAKMPLSSV